MAIPRNARPGIKLPKIGGLRLRRNVKTGKYGRRDVIVGPDGRTYGLTNPGQYQIGYRGEGANRFISLVPRTRSGGAGGPRPATPATPAKPTPPPDEYASYEKDYPWIASYLRSLRSEENAFTDRYTNKIQPGISAGLQSLGKIGEGTANTYGGQVGTSPQQPGYVSNIYNVAANLTPAQVASGMGGAASVADPNSVAARQGLASSASASSQADARYRSLMAGLTPVSTAQGILGNLATQATTISKAYADKRISERTRLDQWIAEQKAGAEDRQIRQQYNMAMLGFKEEGLALDRERLNRQGQKTNAELAADGFRKVSEVAKAGPKWKDKIAASTVTSIEGEAWYKPATPARGSGSGSGGPTASQRDSFTQGLYDAYYGKQGVINPQTQVLEGGLPGYRDKPGQNSWQRQSNDIAAYIQTGKADSLAPKTEAQVRAMLQRTISNPQYKVDSIKYGTLAPKVRKQMFDRVINILRKNGYFN